MRSLVKRELVMDQPLKNFHAYFYGIKPRNLVNVIDRIIADSPDVQAKISAVAALDDETGKVVYFVVEVACEETISYETSDAFRSLQSVLRKERLISV